MRRGTSGPGQRVSRNEIARAEEQGRREREREGRKKERKGKGGLLLRGTRSRCRDAVLRSSRIIDQLLRQVVNSGPHS